jgi:hypothetical protein
VIVNKPGKLEETVDQVVAVLAQEREAVR